MWWSKNCTISEISRTPKTNANPATNPPIAHTPPKTATSKLFQINNATLYILVVTLSINNNIRFFEHLKQGFRKIDSNNKYRSELRTKPKNNNLNCMIDPTFRNINRLFVLSFKNSNNDPTRNSF